MVVVFPHQNYKNGSSTGTNSINTAVRYLLNDEGRDKKPEVVKGDIGYVMYVTNSIDNKQKYTSLVLSFRDDEKPTHKQQLEIINKFEAVAFAGLKPDDYLSLWVRHEDKGNVELHCLVPKIHLPTGKALNIRPPGKFSEDLMDSFRDLVNLDHGWKDVAQGKDSVKPKFHGFELKKMKLDTAANKTEFKIELTKFLVAQAQIGNIKNRDDVVSTLNEMNFQVVRQGDDYVSIKHPSDPNARNMRLKGGIYGLGFDLNQGESNKHREKDSSNNRDRKQEITQKLERCVEARANFNEGRYNKEQKSTNHNDVGNGINTKPIGSFSHSKNSEIRVSFTESVKFTKSEIKEVGNGRVDPVRTRANAANHEFDKAIRSAKSNCGKLSSASSAAATTNKQLSAANAKIGAEVGRIKSAHPAISSSALGSISSIEMSIAGEVGKMATAKSILERAAIQIRINELMAQLEKAKQRYIEEKNKGFGYGGR